MNRAWPRVAVALAAALALMACRAQPTVAPVTPAPGPAAPVASAPREPVVPPAVPVEPAQVAPAPLPPLDGYQKLQLHAHTDESADSRTKVPDVIAFYAARGYDAIVLTDHNRVTVAKDHGQMLVIAGIELTYNTRDCDPPPEKRKCLVHMNALFVRKGAPNDPPLPKPASRTRLDLYLRFVDVIAGLGALPMLNHPNFGWTANAELAIALAGRGVRLIEIANQGMPESNPGDALHVPVEQLWDQILSSGARMWGVASDDAHHYDAHEAALREVRGEVSYPGDLGWVMVHAERTPQALRAALERGDFYASTGVTLAELADEPDALVVAAAGEGPFRVECITTGGAVAQVVEGARARCALPVTGYVRARITDGEGRMAWTQPRFR